MMPHLFTIILIITPLGFSIKQRPPTPEETAIIHDVVKSKDSSQCFSNLKIKRLQKYCVQQVAIKTKDTKHCNLLKTSRKANCYGLAAKELGDKKICDHFEKQSVWHNKCIYNFEGRKTSPKITL